MALFGTFRDIAPDEVLGLVEHKEGVLEVGNDVKIFIKNGYIAGMEFRGQKMGDKTRYMAVLVNLLEDQDSPFRFYRGRVEEVGEKIPISLLLLESAAKRDEVNRYSLDSVDERAVFVLDEESRNRLSRLMRASGNGNSDLIEFIKEAYFILKEGATPVEISRRLNLPLEWTKYVLYRLRVLRIVRVRRRKADRGIIDKVRGLYRKITFLLRRSSIK